MSAIAALFDELEFGFKDVQKSSPLGAHKSPAHDQHDAIQNLAL